MSVNINWLWNGFIRFIMYTWQTRKSKWKWNVKCDSTGSARLMTWLLPFASLHTIWLEISKELISFLWNMKQNAMKSSFNSALWSHRANIRTTPSRANQPNKFYKLLFLEFYSFYELKLVCCRYLWRHEGKQTERQISLPVLSQFSHPEPPRQ